jgi:hypothetical protein
MATQPHTPPLTHFADVECSKKRGQPLQGMGLLKGCAERGWVGRVRGCVVGAVRGRWVGDEVSGALCCFA